MLDYLNGLLAASGMDPIKLGWLLAAIVLAGLYGRSDKGGGK